MREDRARALGTVRDLADHVEHIKKVAGIDHVGIAPIFAGRRPTRI
jgi:microsomal dipeptidase-like Zn-dependent dipeptidase